MFGLGFPELLLILIVLVAVLGFITVLVVAVGAIIRSLHRQSAGLKVCPFCAERIQRAAVICRFCNRDVGDATQG